MIRSFSRRRRLISAAAASLMACTLATWAGPASTAMADTSPGPPIPGLNCAPEQFPHAGAPRSAPSVPYEIPFTGTLGQVTPTGLHEGGYLQISNSLVTATLGAPLLPDPTTGAMYGSIFAKLCGVLQLPSQTGAIDGNPYGLGNDPNYNNNFVFDPDQINVALSVTGIPGLPVLSAFGAADGSLSAAIGHQPAANGGLVLDFYGAAKSTSNFGPALASLVTALLPGSGVTLPPAVTSLLSGAGITQAVGNVAGASCTIAIGNLVAGGVKNLAATGLTTAEATAPVFLTTGSSGHLTGLAATGPITDTDATLVANDFPVGAIVPNTTPAPGFGNAVCTQANASLLNSLLGLPSIPDPATGHYPNIFYAPSTFGVYTSA